MNEDIFNRLRRLDSHDYSREDYVRSPLCGYPGSKARSLDNILPLLPYRNGFCEPFGGSAAVLLARQTSPLEVYNDRYGGVVAFYRCIRDEKTFDRLVERLSWVVHAREEFIWCKETWEDCQDDVERAARWYYATDFSFTRQIRSWARSTHGPGQQGASYRRRLSQFQPVHERLANVQIENQDWRQCIRDYDDEDMVFYLDPPYIGTDTGVYKYKMSVDDHLELLDTIFSSKAFFALSGYENPYYEKYPWDEKYTWLRKSPVEAQAFHESNNLKGHEEALRRGMAKEVLWVKESD